MEKITIREQPERSSLHELLQRADTQFVVETALNLQGIEVEMKQSSFVDFEGGSLRNGRLKGFLNFRAEHGMVFGKGLEFADDMVLNVSHLRPEWFGAVGNYDFRTHKGNDDTEAINRAIAVAEQLAVKTVKFGAVNYFSSGIVIRQGNIWLQGSGAQLREDLWKRGKTEMDIVGVENSRTGTLWCRPGISCITCSEEVGNPIYVSDLQLICDREAAEAGKAETVGIDFKASVNAPTWPVTFERCYFRGFDKAFCLNSRLHYPIDYLKFAECAFLENGCCVYSNAAPEEYSRKYGITRQLTWAFEFINNRCHHNGRVVSLCVHKGLCRIENNNCEGTYGYPKDGNREEQYALDVQLGQRANAIICHNHFEQNKTQLIKVTSTDGVDSTATVTHNNTDGTSSPYDRSHFEKVVLSTDRSAEIKDCIVESDFITTHHYLLDGNASAYLLHSGKWPLNSQSSLPVEIGSTSGIPETFIDTPLGRKCMGYYYANSFSTSTVLSQSIVYDPNRLFLNIEVPYFRKSANPLFSNIYLRISYLKDGKVISASDLNPRYLYSNRSGFYRLRVQACLEKTEGCSHIHVHMAVYTDTHNLNADGELYLGRRAVLATAERLDLNYNLLKETGVEITGSKDDSYILAKGDRFVAGCFDITCLEGGCCLPDSEFSTDGEAGCVITAVKPVGTAWTDGKTTFRIVGLAENGTPDYKKMKYYVDIPVENIQNGHIYHSKTPVLLGNGSGGDKDMETAIVSRLAPGSGFFNTERNTYYILNKERQWEKSSLKPEK